MKILKAAALFAMTIVASYNMGMLCDPPLVLTVTSPATGDFVNASTVTVTGSINKPATDHVVDINGTTGTINPDMTFSVDVPLDAVAIFNPLVIEVSNAVSGQSARELRTVVAGDSVADGAFSLESVALRINDSGLDSLEPVVGGLVDLDLATLVPTGTVLIDQCFVDGGFLGCLGSAKVSVVNPAPKIDSFGIGFDSQTNQVNADVDLNGLEINVFLDGSGLVPNCDLRMTATGTNIDGNYTLEPESGGSGVDVAQLGTANVAFTGFNHEFTSGLCDFPLLGTIIQAFLPDIEATATSGVSGFLNAVDGNGNTPIAAAVETALAGIDISGPIGSSLGSDLSAPLFAVTEDNSGLTLGSDVSFLADCTPPADAPDLAASYHVAEPFPTFGATTPGSGTPYGVGICISTSGLNQLLKAQTECGLLVTTITELGLLGAPPAPITTETLAGFIPSLASYQPPEPVQINIIPTMAPVFTGEPGPGGELATLKIGHLLVQIETTNNGAVLLEGAVDATLGVDLTVDEMTNTLNFQLAAPDIATIGINFTKNLVQANEALLGALLPILIADLLPDLASSLASFPVPSFLDLQLSVVEVDQNGEFISIFADLQAP